MVPRSWMVGGVELKCAGVGGVCSHPVLARGAGYVQQLMDHILARMKAEGYHLSVLGGIRQRYAYYGYEKCGVATSYSINRSNVRRYFAESSSVDMTHDESSSAPGMRSAPLAVTFTAAASEPELVAAAQAIQRASPAYCERGDDFALLSSGLHVAHNEGGELVGYLIGSAGSIAELEATSDAAAVGMVAAWVLGNGAASGRIHGDDDGNQSVGVRLSPWQAAGPLGIALGRFAEAVSMTHDHNWLV